MIHAVPFLAATLVLASTQVVEVPRTVEAPSGRPDVSIDLTTQEGVDTVRGAWRASAARLVEVDFRRVGPDRKPTGPANRTFDVEPAAGVRDFDDSDWEVLDPTGLDRRLGDGLACFVWYRMRLTIPERVGADLDPTGATIVFETVVDDYAEVWVDGVLPLALGQRGGPVAAGWNAPNRLVVARDVRPGDVVQLAVFGINGPLSDPPSNYVWMRSARLDVYLEPHAIGPVVVATEVERVSERLDAVVPRGAAIEKLAEGFAFTEGPLWLPEGALLFSDPNRNRIYRWSPAGGLSIEREASGYQGADVGAYGQPGSNGLALDGAGRLVACEHGNRCVSRYERDGTRVVLAERFEGRRLNSPNDLVYRSDGTLYFSDPPFGLPRFHDDERRELSTTGVYRLAGGVLYLESEELSGPNGLAFSPDERFLYVTDWDEARKVVMRHAVRPDGSLMAGEVLFDMGRASEPEALDGIKVDHAGNLFVSGPGGVWVLSPEGEHLGTIRGPELPANFAWGDADGRTLYMTARHGLYRLRLADGSGRVSALASPR